MSFEKKLLIEIEKECNKLINRFHLYHNTLDQEFVRNNKRFKNVPVKEIKRPAYWETNRGCDPFYVRKHRKAIAKSIFNKIKNRKYCPFTPVTVKIPKKDGGERSVCIYEIADATVSRLFYRRLLDKNKHRFSSFSYSYRNDRNVHFAIQDISIDLARNARSFVAEFDFTDFFGNISHEYLFNQFSSNGFNISSEEEFVIKSFLDLKKGKGIPQGTSISLFLANLACWQLDYRLEKEGLKFARYADDTLIWSTDYQKICNAFNLINSFSLSAAIPINLEKSEGISLLTQETKKSELIRSKESVEFLGYSISVSKISFKDESIKNIKKQISYLLYKNLIQPMKNNNYHLKYIDTNADYNLMVALMQIRRYIYGNLTHRQLVNYISGRSKRLNFKGVMSFYPLINDKQQIKNLDSWLICVLYRCLSLRNKMLISYHPSLNNKHFVIGKKNKLRNRLNAIEYSDSRSRLYEVPSFSLFIDALQTGIKNEGLPSFIRKDICEYDY